MDGSFDLLSIKKLKGLYNWDQALYIDRDKFQEAGQLTVFRSKTFVEKNKARLKLDNMKNYNAINSLCFLKDLRTAEVRVLSTYTVILRGNRTSKR